MGDSITAVDGKSAELSPAMNAGTVAVVCGRICGWNLSWKLQANGRAKRGFGLNECEAELQRRVGFLVQKHRPIERVALDGLEAGVADDAAQLLFGGAVRCTGGLDDVLF